MTRGTPFTLLGGYLGAGKTTLVNRLLARPEGRRLALIINDFGAINIDAALIESRTGDTISLTNGCVCCGAGTDFAAALEQLLARRPPPDHVIVEASGVADVVSLAQYGHHPGLHLDGIVVVADAETVRARARDRYVGDTVTRQLAGADLILLNKVDLISPDRLDAVARWLGECAPGVPVIRTMHCNAPTDLLLGTLRAETPANVRENAPATGHTDQSADQHGGHPPGAHAAFATWHFEHPEALPEATVRTFVAALPASVLRAKGLFRVAANTRLVFQQVGRRQSLVATPGSGGTAIVAIGLAGQLDTDALNAQAAIMTAHARSATGD
jgi:G3E family GTPase